MKRKIFTTAILLCCFAICYAIVTDMSGQWASVFNAPDGNAYPLTYTFKIDGDKLTGTLEVAGSAIPIDSGKVSGNNLSFSVNAQGSTYSHKGIYYPAGDSIAMNVTFDGNKQHSTLKRPK